MKLEILNSQSKFEKLFDLYLKYVRCKLISDNGLLN